MPVITQRNSGGRPCARGFSATFFRSRLRDFTASGTFSSLSLNSKAAVFEKSAPKHGKSGEVTRRLCLSIARNLGQSPTYKTIISDMYGGEDNPSSLVTEQTLAASKDPSPGRIP